MVEEVVAILPLVMEVSFLIIMAHKQSPLDHAKGPSCLSV